MDQTAPNQSGDQSKQSNQMLMSVLAYLGILIIIPYLMSKDDEVVKFHIRQGLVLVVIELAVWILGMFTWQLWPLLSLVNLGTIVLAIIGIVNAVQHKQVELPLVGSFAHNFKI